MYAYVGCRTTKERNARGKGISIYHVNDLEWTLIDTVRTIDNPSYLCLDRTGRYLYTVHGDYNDVSAFTIHTDGTLTHINTVRAEGKNPVYITPSLDNRFLFVATLQGGAIATLPIQDNGALGNAVYVAHIAGLTDTGVSHAHQCELDRTGSWLLVPTQGRHIGYERIYVFKVQQDTGELIEHSHVDARTYAEPRHLTISEDNTRVYVINEKGNAVTYYAFDSEHGLLQPLQIIPSLPETYTGQGQASAILLSPNGDFCYATNRIHESIVTYRINGETGFLTTIAYDSVLGETPRFFTYSPDGQYILIANEDSDTIQLFKPDPQTGLLTFTHITIPTPSPTSIVFK